jgi:hypothetical protein
VEHDESRTKAGGERGLWLLDAVFRAGNLQKRQASPDTVISSRFTAVLWHRKVCSYQSSVAADEMVHGLCKVELADRREHTERVAGQEDDVLRVRSDARYLCVGDVLDRVRGPRVLCSKITAVRKIKIRVLL